jgi:hypothetical protein
VKSKAQHARRDTDVKGPIVQPRAHCLSKGLNNRVGPHNGVVYRVGGGGEGRGFARDGGDRDVSQEAMCEAGRPMAPLEPIIVSRVLGFGMVGFVSWFRGRGLYVSTIRAQLSLRKALIDNIENCKSLFLL